MVSSERITDITVVTTIGGPVGIVNLKLLTAGEYGGKGKAWLNDIEADLNFHAGSAEATVRVPGARFWSPSAPYLFPLAITLTGGERVTDSYTLDIEIRSVEVKGDQLLLKGKSFKLTGFGKHQDCPIHGRGLDLLGLDSELRVAKVGGVNSHRTSHHSYAEEAMMLADRLGVLVINEVPAVGLNFGDGRS